MPKCKVCCGVDFFKESGYFFCQTCQTQNEDVREEVLELRVDPTTRLRRTRIRRLRSDQSGEELGWTSWELYNFVLIGMTNELIELGVPPNIKLTILQLWATYLGKIEVAFISTKKKCVPKLAKRYNKRDAVIIYGKVRAQKRERKRKRARSSTTTSMISGYQSEGGGSSSRELNRNKRLLVTADYDRYIQSQASSEGDGLSSFNQSVYSYQSSSVNSSENSARLQFSSHAKAEMSKIKRMSMKLARNKRSKYKGNHISTQYKIGPHIVTPMRLWAIIYLALRIHNQPIHIGDMLRYGREGHLSYYKLDHLLPSEISLTKGEVNFLSQNVEITHKGMRRIIASMAKLLGVGDLTCPDFLPLISRYCKELGLPRGILLYTERIIALSPPKMIFDRKKSYIPNYEARAMAFIIVVLKILFALDGVTENHISKLAEKINREVIMLGKKMQLKKGRYQEQNTAIQSCENEKHYNFGEGEYCCEQTSTPRIIVHGGAGNFKDSIIIEKITACKKAAANGYQKLKNGGTSVEAVETALWWLECDEFFNCSYGSALNEIGKVQMDASMMDGSTFKCGSVAALSDVEHPISLARYVMENFPNSIFVGEGAKNLAKHANLNWISEGNMVAPMARIAFKLGETGTDEADCDIESFECAEALTNGFGTVGCVAYDGFSIAAGTTTGGLNRKLVGRVGDTPILGCGTYAQKYIGCSLTGHGESIIKLGLSRAIVKDVEDTVPAEEALERNFSYMFDKYKKTGGGVVLQSNGRWAMHFTTDRMPYAVIEDDLITFGADPNEKRTETYCDSDVAIEKGLLGAKLFNFQDWQRYIECRKAVLVHSHFPTKLKYSPEAHGIDSLYIKFLDFVNSKGDREKPEVQSHKHLIPEELVDAMKKYICNLNDDDLPPKEIELFPPSLTPLHSYLQQLLDHPTYDLPSAVRTDFFLTKVAYTTKSNSLLELAEQCNIPLDIVDSSLHFLEKIVPPFEQARMPSVDELKELVDVEDHAGVEDGKSENLNDYTHRKIPCKMKLNVEKEQYYDRVRNSMKDFENMDVKNDFTFTDVLPNGRLAIPSDSDSDSENGDMLVNKVDGGSKLLDCKFSEKYNLCLSHIEKESICSRGVTNSVRFKKKPILQLIRNAKGQFVRRSGSFVNVEESVKDGDSCSRSQELISDSLEFDGSKLFGIDLNDIDISATGNINSIELNDNDYFNLSDISILCDDNSNLPSAEGAGTSAGSDRIPFFRPFKDYWMYHCIFSRVKSKNFESFEKTLPRSFRWLLNECAHIVEMSTEDLYEEVCLIESYHAHILKSTASGPTDDCNSAPMSKLQMNLILNRW